MWHSTLYTLTTSGPNRWFMNSIVFWGFIMLGAMTIGGFFMFRKFIKVLPKADGMSKLDWQNHWVEKSRHLWTDDAKSFLELLVAPVPSAFRDIAKHSIAAEIGKIALQDSAEEVTRDHCIKGYIVATPQRDNKFLVRFLEKNQIDYSPYQHLLNK